MQGSATANDRTRGDDLKMNYPAGSGRGIFKKGEERQEERGYIFNIRFFILDIKLFISVCLTPNGNQWLRSSLPVRR